MDCTDAKRRIAACAHQKLFLCILVTLFADSQCISSWFIFKLQRVHTAIGFVNSKFLKWHSNAVLEEKLELGLHDYFLCYHLSEFKSDECFLLCITAASDEPHQQKNDGSCKKSFMFHSLWLYYQCCKRSYASYLIVVFTLGGRICTYLWSSPSITTCKASLSSSICRSLKSIPQNGEISLWRAKYWIPAVRIANWIFLLWGLEEEDEHSSTRGSAWLSISQICCKLIQLKLVTQILRQLFLCICFLFYISWHIPSRLIFIL